MARLPQPGGDNGNWGDILNDFILQSLKADGSIKADVIGATQIADGSITEPLLAPAVQTKLNAVAGTPDWTTITNKPAVIVAGATATAAKAVVGLDNVDNTSDATKNSASVTLTNKTLKQAIITDGNDNPVLQVGYDAPTSPLPASINYGVWDTGVELYSGNGTGADLDFYISQKGIGAFALYAAGASNNTRTIFADGDGADVHLNLATKGNGKVKINGVDIATTSSPVCTTATGDIGTEDGANTWAKIATYSTGTAQFADCSLILSVTNSATETNDSAIVSVFFRSNSTGTNPTVDVQIMAVGGSGPHILSDSFKVISGAWSTDMELWFKKGANYGRFNFYETSKNDNNNSLTYTTSPAWQSATPSGAVNNVSSNGVTAFSVPVVTTTAIQTLANKTLATPKINGILDSNSNSILYLQSAASAVNYVEVDNAATGTDPQIYGWSNTDTNVGLDLKTKGTGTVKANGNPVAVEVLVPVSANAPGAAGQIAYDSGYIYICTATNTWKRSPVASW